jgi:hypothetical protein
MRSGVFAPEKGGPEEEASIGSTESNAETEREQGRKDTKKMTNTQITRTNNYILAALTALVAALVALSILSAPAVGEQSTDSKQNAPASSKKQAALVNTSSTTTPKATFASGSGANFLGVKVSDHGNLMSFESPQGKENVFSNAEGYAVCSNFVNTIHGHDTGSVEAGFGVPTFSQPTAGKFPLTVTRKTTDGKFQLKQVWNKPDPVEKDVTVTMTLTNLSSSTINNVFVSRSGDFDVGATSQNQGARTSDTAWQWNDPSTNSTSRLSGGVMLTAATFGAVHDTFVEPRADWAGGTRESCFARSPDMTTPTSVQDLAMRAYYALFDLDAGQSKTVKFEYRSM